MMVEERSHPPRSRSARHLGPGEHGIQPLESPIARAMFADNELGSTEAIPDDEIRKTSQAIYDDTPDKFERSILGKVRAGTALNPVQMPPARSASRRSHNTSAGVLICPVDLFKSLNDNHLSDRRSDLYGVITQTAEPVSPEK